jgi:ABC-type multidrug transport system fused ATPase/permease subunit
MSLSYRKLAVVGVLSVAAGVGQAALLLVIVRGATALTADTEVISGSVGPISAADLTTGDLVVVGFVVLVFLLVVEVAMSFVQAALLVDASRGAQRRMLERYSAATFEAQTSLSRGEARQVVMGHPTTAGAVATSLGSGLSAVVNFTVLVGSAVVLSPVAALVVLIGLVTMILALRPILAVTRRLSDRRAREQRALSGRTAERFELNRELKAFGAEANADATIMDGIDSVARADRRVRVLSRLSSVVYRLGVFALILVMLAIIDASNSTNLAALTGALLMLLRSLSYGQAAQSSFQSLGETVPVIEQMLEEHERLGRHIEAHIGTPAPADFHIGELSLDRVDFAYPGAEPVLHQVSMRVGRGDFIALVGPSGAGKTTLMQLLLRLRRPTAGLILVDGSPIEDVPLDWWRRRVAYVPQEPKLQSGTVADAIRLGRRGLSDAAVRRAAERAHVAEEVGSWPLGYDTPLLQLGESVSGGQRQRLALARALVGEPDLLLLDEPTSALDPVSERLVARTLEELRGRMTILVIAHRRETVEHADRVVRVECGRVTTQEADVGVASVLEDDEARRAPRDRSP